jgi:hypothetical protein
LQVRKREAAEERERERAYLAVEEKPISEKLERERFSYLSDCPVSTAAMDSYQKMGDTMAHAPIERRWLQFLLY